MVAVKPAELLKNIEINTKITSYGPYMTTPQPETQNVELFTV